MCRLTFWSADDELDVVSLLPYCTVMCTWLLSLQASHPWMTTLYVYDLVNGGFLSMPCRQGGGGWQTRKSGCCDRGGRYSVLVPGFYKKYCTRISTVVTTEIHHAVNHSTTVYTSILAPEDSIFHFVYCTTAPLYRRTPSVSAISSCLLPSIT